MSHFTRTDPDNREHWLSLRRNLITASDAAAITGDSPFLDFDGVIRRKLSGEEIETTQPMWFGTMREECNLRIFEAMSRLDCMLDGSLCTLNSHHYVGCTLDAYVKGVAGEVYWELCQAPRSCQLRDLPYSILGEGTPIELKNVQSKNRSLWNKDAVPRYYWCQAQVQLLVTGKPIGLLVASVDACEVYAHVIHADDRYHAKFLAAAAKAHSLLEEGIF